VIFAIICPYLDFKTASTISTSIVRSKLDYCNSFQTVNLTGFNKSKTLLLALLSRLLNPHISLPFSNLYWLKVNERTEYKLLSLTYKILTTSQPSYLQSLISIQPPSSTRSSSVVTLSRPPTISSLKITGRSFRYASPGHLVFGINFQIHFVSLINPVSIYLLMHLSTHPCRHRHSQHPSLLHSRLKTFSFPP